VTLEFLNQFLLCVLTYGRTYLLLVSSLHVVLSCRHWTQVCGAESRSSRVRALLLDAVVSYVQGGQSFLDLNHGPCTMILDFYLIS
jgi:hypothetical protein